MLVQDLIASDIEVMALSFADCLLSSHLVNRKNADLECGKQASRASQAIDAHER